MYQKILKKIFTVKKTDTQEVELSYDVHRQCGINIKNDFAYSWDTQSLINYQTLNKIKEIELKRKIRDGKKVRVVFLLDSLSKFSCAEVYKAMAKNSLFEPIIVLGYTDEEELVNDVDWDKHLNEYETLKNNGYNAYSLYDEHRNYIPVDTFKPDILFLSAPYLDQSYSASMHLSNIYLNVNYLVCYLKYGFSIINNYWGQFNNRRPNTGWKQFINTRYEYKEHMKYSRDCGINTVLSGYPKLDTYAKPIEECKIPKKIDNGNPIVIYAPHWTIKLDFEPQDLSTFDIYYKYFLDLVKKNPNINFVFKPHPHIERNIKEHNIMPIEEYHQYVKEWDSQPNGLYVYDGEYIDLFRKSSLLITDSGSFVAEYIPSENPCMYLVKPSRDQKRYMDCFSLAGRKILEKYYLCYNQNDIEQYFNMLMFDKKDPMKEDRLELIDTLFINIGCAGQKIVDYLEDILTEME